MYSSIELIFRETAPLKGHSKEIFTCFFNQGCTGSQFFGTNDDPSNWRYRYGSTVPTVGGTYLMAL